MSLTLTQLIETTLAETGEFILADLESLAPNISKNVFWALAKRALSAYNEYRHYTQELNVTVSNQFYAWSASPPDWVSSVSPVSTSGDFDVFQYMEWGGNRQDISEYTLLRIPRAFEWKYERPKLYVTEDGIMDIKAHWHHAYMVELVEEGGTDIEEVTMATIDPDKEDRLFIDLVVAKFLVSLGRSRRAFTMNDVPITMDSAELVTEGNELWQTTMEKLQEQQQWWDGLPSS